MVRRTLSCDPYGIILIKILSPVGTVCSRLIGSRWYFISLLCSWLLIYAANIVWFDNRRIIVHLYMEHFSWCTCILFRSCWDNLSTWIFDFIICGWHLIYAANIVCWYSAHWSIFILEHLFGAHVSCWDNLSMCRAELRQSVHLIHFSYICWDNLSICRKLQIWINGHDKFAKHNILC